MGISRLFQSVAIISTDKLSIIPLLYTESLKPRFHSLCKQDLHMELVLLNISRIT